MAGIRVGFAMLAITSVAMMGGCYHDDTPDNGTPGGESTGGETTGGETTGGETTGGETTGGETTGGETTGGETTGGETTGGETTGGETTGGETTGGETTGGSTGGDSASACFNPQLSTIGSRLVWVYRSTDGETGITLTTTSDILVKQKTTFNGHNAIEAVADVDAVSSDPTGSSQSTTKTYTSVDADNYSSQAFGTVTDVTSPITSTINTKLNPPIEHHYDIDPGQSYTQTSTITVDGTTSAGGMSFPIPPVDTTQKLKRTYVGRDSITVPAGTFETCHFQDDATVDGNTVTTDLWMAVGSGVEVKSVASGDENVLVSATINGTPID
jgi:hypothetical protein